jgi:DNA-binding NarL/FixJ family response regulator
MASDFLENDSTNKGNGELFSRHEWDRLLDHLSLPDRQAEILQFLLNGENDKQIAQKLRISLPTIRTHLQRIYARFDVSNRTSLVVEVFRKFRTLEEPFPETRL